MLQKKFHTPLLAAASISLIFVGGVIQNLLIIVSRACQTSGLANLFARCRDERSEYRHREGKRSKTKGKGFPKVPQLSKILETTPLLAAASIFLIFVGGVIQNLLINVSRAC